MRGTLDTRLGLRPSKAFARPVPLTADVVLVALWPVSLMAHTSVCTTPNVCHMSDTRSRCCTHARMAGTRLVRFFCALIHMACHMAHAQGARPLRVANHISYI